MHGLTCLFDLSTLYNTCQGYIWHLFVVAHPIGVYPSSLSHPKLASKPLWQSCPWLRLPENDRSRLSDSLVLFTTRLAILPFLRLALNASDGPDLKILFNLVIRVYRNDALFFLSRLLRLFRCRLFRLRLDPGCCYRSCLDIFVLFAKKWLCLCFLGTVKVRRWLEKCIFFVLVELRNSFKLDTTSLSSLLSLRPSGSAMDLTTAYRYNQNMMEYYTCKVIFWKIRKKPYKSYRYLRLILFHLIYFL